ncbi:MAG: hypothetical protein PHU25_08830 [Deltaproteobacteria bacterium]|nr:hypothetical protein [Deltaproteobacteria bacterium]
MTHTTRIAILVGLSLACLAGCGGRRPAGNTITPIRLTGCPAAQDAPADQRSLAAMIAAMQASRYAVYKVSPAEFKVFTDYTTVRGMQVAFEAQIYSDGSASLYLPSTMPMQSGDALAKIQKYADKLARTFDRLKCMPTAWLRLEAARAGYVF